MQTASTVTPAKSPLEGLLPYAALVGAMLVMGLSRAGIGSEHMLPVVAAMCLIAAWIAQKLHRACD